MVVIPGFFNLTYIKNTGAAFGIFQESSFSYWSHLLAIGLFLFLLIARTRRKNRVPSGPDFDSRRNLRKLD
jgi:lipoprotein signal peptidase